MLNVPYAYLLSSGFAECYRRVYYMASIRFDESCNLISQFEVQILP